MIVTALSDLHGLLPEITESSDVVLICGDIVPLNIQRDDMASLLWINKNFMQWADNLPAEKVLFIWGNHDFVGEYIMKPSDPDWNIKDMNEVIGSSEKTELLLDNTYNFNGITIYGSPWCPDLKRWAFYQDSDGLKKKFSKIPNNTDILMTHCPPQVENYGAVTQSDNFNYGSDYGCQELAHIIKEKKPKLSLFGHVHSGSHSLQKIGNTYFCNVSILDERYKQAYNIKRFQIDTENDFTIQDISLRED